METKQTPKEEAYNGWSNRETWAFKLHIDNNEGDYNYWQERTREAEGREAFRYAVSEEDFHKKCGAAGVALVAEPPGSVEKEASPTTPRPTTTSIMTRRMTRAEMFLGQVVGERRIRAGSRTAAFEDGEVPSPEKEKASQPGAESPGESADPRTIAGRQILVVDDDAEIRDLLVRMLQGAGARVKAVGEARQALAEVKSGTYDLATFDILMPDVSGMELYDQAVDLVPELRERVLFTTGHNTEGTLRDRIASRGGRLLHKPFDTAELLRATASVLGSQRKVS